MAKRSSVEFGVILKHFWRFVPYPRISTKLAKLELEKQFFNLLYPSNNHGRARKIRQASFRITDLCNLRCRTCGQWGESGFLHGKDLKDLKKEEVSPDRYQEIFVDLVRHGHRPIVYFWGGEPMLYDGILDLIEDATALGLPTSIATNGTRIAASADRLVKAPLFLLQISIDGHCSETHNALRPAAGGTDNFREINAGLKAVNDARKTHKRDLPLIASLTVISQGNFRHLIDIYEAFRYKVDLFVFYLSWWIDPEGARSHDVDFSRRFGFMPTKHWGWIGDWRPRDYSLLNRQLKSLLDRSSPRTATPVIIIPKITGTENLKSYYTDHQSRFGFNRCVSIYQAVEVNSNGNVSPCRDYHDYVVGNIKSDTITKLWNSTPYRNFRQSLRTEGLMPVCSRCCGLMGY